MSKEGQNVELLHVLIFEITERGNFVHLTSFLILLLYKFKIAKSMKISLIYNKAIKIYFFLLKTFSIIKTSKRKNLKLKEVLLIQN